MVEIDHEKLAAARDALGMEKEGGPILSRLAQRLGGAYAREAAKRAAKPGLLSRLKGRGLKLGLLGGSGAGLYQLGKSEGAREESDLDESAGPPLAMILPPATMLPHGGHDSFTPVERMQFARHGINPESLQFAQALGRLRQGMNLEQKMFEQALAGKLPANVLGGGGTEGESLEAYA